MDTVVSEARVTLDAGFFGEDVVVLSLKVALDFGKAGRGQNACSVAVMLGSV